MSVSSMTSKGQITVPATLRREWGLGAADRVRFVRKERSHGVARRALYGIAQALLEHPKYLIADHALLADALAILRATPIGFGDALALAHARANGATLVSFDRKLARCEGAAPV